MTILLSFYTDIVITREEVLDELAKTRQERQRRFVINTCPFYSRILIKLLAFRLHSERGDCTGAIVVVVSEHFYVKYSIPLKTICS